MMIIIYVTCKNKEEAKKIAKAMIDKKLVACANIINSDSLYNWQGKLQDTHESILLMKTSEDRFEKVKEQVKAIHSYDTPCILKIIQ